MNFENLEAVIDFAIEKEQEAADFYDDVAGQTSMSGVAEMFREFSAEEIKHKNFLEDLKKGKADEKVAAYELKWITDLKRSDYLVEMEYEKGMGYKDILSLAMKREEKALQLYNELLQNAKTPEHEKVFKMLAQEEAKHKKFLETKYDDYMAEMGD